MILHHAQAIEMADLALVRATGPHIKDLAGRIKAAQDPEIEKLRSWLRDWQRPAPDTGAAHHMADMEMPSMMSADDVAALSTQSGPAFNRTFLEQMIRHHEGAVTMARTEAAEGEFDEAKNMATSTIDSQSAEITEITDMKDHLGSG
jgi:uncharacterized protein (DUF305 family)